MPLQAPPSRGVYPDPLPVCSLTPQLRGHVYSLRYFTCLRASFVNFLTIPKAALFPDWPAPPLPGLLNFPHLQLSAPLQTPSTTFYPSLHSSIGAGRPACLPTVWLHISSLLCFVLAGFLATDNSHDRAPGERERESAPALPEPIVRSRITAGVL